MSLRLLQSWLYENCYYKEHSQSLPHVHGILLSHFKIPFYFIWFVKRLEIVIRWLESLHNSQLHIHVYLGWPARMSDLCHTHVYLSWSFRILVQLCRYHDEMLKAKNDAPKSNKNYSNLTCTESSCCPGSNVCFVSGFAGQGLGDFILIYMQIIWEIFQMNILWVIVLLHLA